MATKKQALKKLEILVEQVRSHCKVNDLRAYLAVSADEDNRLTFSGYYDQNVVRSIIYQVMFKHPEIMTEMLTIMNKGAEAIAAQESIPDAVVADGSTDVVNPALKIVAPGDEGVNPPVRLHTEP
jgi:hypothetical protein